MEIKIDEFQFSSSDVQKMEEDKSGNLKINIYPHWAFIDPQRVKSVFCSHLFRLGNNPRFLNHGNDLFIFADETHRIHWLKVQGFSEAWIANNLLPMGEVINFPTGNKTPEAEREVA